MSLEQVFALGFAHQQAGQFAEAGRIFGQVVSIQPNHATALHMLGLLSHQTAQYAASADFLRRAIAAKPDFPDAYVDLGNTLAAMRMWDEAIAAYRRAIELKDDYAAAYGHLGCKLIWKGEYEAALAACRQCLAINPDIPAAHCLIGLVQLTLGNYAEGLPEYEYRMGMPGYYSVLKSTHGPRWDGRELPGGTILLHAEQGFGDTFQFVRYVPLVAKRCARVFVVSQPQLRGVVESMGNVARWIARPDPFPRYDAHCPLMSLPMVFGTTSKRIPNPGIYLHADPARMQKWRGRMADQPGGMRVGIAWAGRPDHCRDSERSISLSTLAPLAGIENVTYYSLQKGETAQQAKNCPAGMNLVDWTDELLDFSDTAALIANLDLVISVDTAVVHLAAAMGKPVWTMLPFVPDWRWMLKPNDTPWYSTMRLFRQPKLGDWESVIGDVTKALQNAQMRTRQFATTEH